jgi:hypothetical protein
MQSSRRQTRNRVKPFSRQQNYAFTAYKKFSANCMQFLGREKKAMKNTQEKRQEIRRFLESLDMYEDTDTKSHLTESSGKDRSGESLGGKQEMKQRIRRLIEKLIFDDGDSESRLRESDGEEAA